ncbi:MAG: hypothetical protein HYZ85_03175 [Candidatus Omnitrophica bacterium]|nr:hypothetical protein [Candidatus Omnitrophota bacterium]
MKVIAYVLLFMFGFASLLEAENFRRTTADMYDESYRTSLRSQMENPSILSPVEIQKDKGEVEVKSILHTPIYH